MDLNIAMYRKKKNPRIKFHFSKKKYDEHLKFEKVFRKIIGAYKNDMI